MNIANIMTTSAGVSSLTQSTPTAPKADGDDPKLHEAFNDFVGQTFYGEMLKAMRKTQHKPAYLYGGRAEEVFQQQLDQILAKKMSDSSSGKLTGPMYELFAARRR
jgi:flagellar protein FlgJ